MHPLDSGTWATSCTSPNAAPSRSKPTERRVERDDGFRTAIGIRCKETNETNFTLDKKFNTNLLNIFTPGLALDQSALVFSLGLFVVVFLLRQGQRLRGRVRLGMRA